VKVVAFSPKVGVFFFCSIIVNFGIISQIFHTKKTEKKTSAFE
jgi:hypothetical protein